MDWPSSLVTETATVWVPLPGEAGAVTVMTLPVGVPTMAAVLVPNFTEMVVAVPVKYWPWMTTE